MNQLNVVIRQDKTNFHLVFAQPIIGVHGLKIELLSSNAVVNLTNSIALDCNESRTGHIFNTGSLFGIPTNIIWVQPFPIPTFNNQLKSTKFNFTTRNFKELHLDLKPNNITFGVGGYLEWKITFYCIETFDNSASNDAMIF